MAKVNYMSRLRTSGASALHSQVCNVCYRKRVFIPFFGVEISGVIQGVRPQDQKFRKAIWTAAKKHMQEEHGLEFVSNGHVDGFKLKPINKEGENRGS